MFQSLLMISVANKGTENASDEINRLSDETSARKSYNCLLCDYSTNHTANVNMHEKTHQQNKEFKCNLCNYSSNLNFVVNRHMKRDHRQANSIIPENCGEEVTRSACPETSVDV